MNALEIIDQRKVLEKDFRIYGTIEDPLFLAKDVADWIDYSKSNVSKLVDVVDENEKVRNIITTQGGNQETWFLTEDGLYEVLMQSRKPIAKEFKKQVKQILRSIRKHGMYATPSTVEQILADPDNMIRIFSEIKAEREKNKVLEKEKAQLEHKVEKDRPKVLFADAVSVSDSAILIGDLAKILRQNGVEMGQTRLFQWLRENGYLIKQRGSSYNMPTQKAMKLGLFKIKETCVTHSDGHTTLNRTPKVTGKGQVYLLNKILDRKVEQTTL